MDSRRFTTWTRQLPALTGRQRQQLLEALRPALGLDRLYAAFEGRSSAKRKCLPPPIPAMAGAL